MTDNRPTSGEEPSDLAGFANDTLLLDTLGSGQAAPPADLVASMLAAWRADLAADLPAAGWDPAGLGLVAATPNPQHPPRGGRRSRPVARRVVGVAASVLVAGTGIAVGAGHSTPDNPLWPITRVLYPERAESAAAEHTLALAREAAVQGRPDEARDLLGQAEKLVARVGDQRRAQWLRGELMTVQRMLPASAPGTPTPATTTGPESGPTTTGPESGPTTTGPESGPTGPTPQPGEPAPGPTGAAPQPKVPAGGGVMPPAVPVLPPAGVPLPTATSGARLAPQPTGGLPRLLP
jgi:hypothetical protein